MVHEKIYEEQFDWNLDSLLVITDRATFFTRLQKIGNRNSDIVNEVMIKKLKQFKDPIHALTLDNDKVSSIF